MLHQNYSRQNKITMTLREAIADIEACETEKEAKKLATIFQNNAIVASWKFGGYGYRRWVEMVEKANEKAEKLNAEWWAEWQADREQNEALGK